MEQIATVIIRIFGEAGYFTAFVPPASHNETLGLPAGRPQHCDSGSALPAIRCLRAAALALGKALGGGGGSASVSPWREALNRAATCA